jgi:S-DNA-T family DNA segregation ATPase FtsK/SpoIIIE
MRSVGFVDIGHHLPRVVGIASGIEPGAHRAGKRLLDVVCDECGFDYDGVSAHSVPDRLRRGGRELVAALHGDVRAHPLPGWSQLEYACHVRDVMAVQLDRIELALREDCPTFEPMGRDERAVRDAYDEQDPDDVRRQVVATANALADYLEALTPEQRARTGIYGYPAPAERTIVWIGINTVHELVHHALDITRR